MVILRPLFPPEVYSKIALVPKALDSSVLAETIRSSFNLEPSHITLRTLDQGVNCIWNEVESVNIGEMNWLTQEFEPLSITQKRVATLTNAIETGLRILAIFSTSDAVTENICNIIYSNIKDMGWKILEAPLDFQKLSKNLRYRPDFEIENVSIDFSEDETEVLFATFKISSPLLAPNTIKKLTRKSGRIESLGITIRHDVPITVSKGEVIIRDANTNFDLFPILLLHIYGLFGEANVDGSKTMQ